MLDLPVINLVEAVSRVLSRIKIKRVNLGGLHIEISDELASSDERISKLEEAQKNLSESLTAIEELKREAKNAKAEAEAALVDLVEIEKDKVIADGELAKVNHATQTDVDTFRKLAGIPTDTQIRRDKVISFWTGFAASLLASIAFALLVFGWGAIKGHVFGDKQESAHATEQTSNGESGPRD